MPGMRPPSAVIVWPAWPPSPHPGHGLAAGRRQAPQRQPALHPAGLVGLRRGDVEGELRGPRGPRCARGARLAISTPCRWWRAMSREKPASTESAVGRRPCGRCRGRPPARRRAAPGRRRSPRAAPSAAAARRGRPSGAVARSSAGSVSVRGSPASSSSACRSGRPGRSRRRRPAGSADEGRVLAAGAGLGVNSLLQRQEVGELLDPLVVDGVHLQLVVPRLEADRGVQADVGREHPAGLASTSSASVSTSASETSSGL